jgi:hypothetical protein
MSDVGSEQPPSNQLRGRGSGNGVPWPKGTSGNPGGRPKGIEALARQHTEEALAVLVGALADSDRRVAVSAAGMLLAYGWGRPKQMLVATDDAQSLTLMHLVAARASSDRINARYPGGDAGGTTIDARPEPPLVTMEDLMKPALE